MPTSPPPPSRSWSMTSSSSPPPPSRSWSMSSTSSSPPVPTRSASTSSMVSVKAPSTIVSMSPSGKPRMPTLRQNSIVRAVNSIMPAVKLNADDVQPDSEAAKAIAAMTKELETSAKVFVGWDSQLSKFSGHSEWEQVVQGVQSLQNDTDAALQAARQLRINQQGFANAMVKLLNKSQANPTQRLLDGSAELLVYSDEIAGQSDALQQHVAGMRDQAQQLARDIEAAKLANKAKASSGSWAQNLASTVKAIFRACSIMLTALAAVLPAVPSFGVPAAVIAGAGGAITGGIADGAEQIEKVYNRTLKKELILTTAAQEVKGVILRLNEFPAMQRVLEIEMALQSGRVVRMRSSAELLKATEAWRTHMQELA